MKLDFADGRHWIICPVDDRAAAVVAELARVMQLGPASRSDWPGSIRRELYVAVCGGSGRYDRSDPGAGGAVVCCLPEPTDPDMRAIGMTRIADAIARESLGRGGLLLHGALAEFRGSGFIMAGPGTVGKSTASRRLPSPWRSLCDDTTLVVRDGSGGYQAHPWPTWSRFFLGGPGGTWPVEHAVPLRAIFFLSQAPSDKLEPVSTMQATALILESDFNLVRATNARIPNPPSLIPAGIGAARALAAAVPAYSLQLSLDGPFWRDIECVLPVGAAPTSAEKTCNQYPAAIEPQVADGSLRLVYTGTSMNPTLVEPELLEVRPYGVCRVRPGDVVCFKAPEQDLTVVHRVVAVERRGTADGRQQGRIRTRGDNCEQDDAWILQAGDIIGRVRVAHRGARRRAIPGGRRGLVARRWIRLGRGIRRRAGLVPHGLYRLLAGLGPFDWLLPMRLRPRLVRFDARYRVYLKLLMGRQTIGQYDDRRHEWYIRRPFRLFVKEQALSTVPAADHGP